jgi:hypothetical protein
MNPTKDDWEAFDSFHGGNDYCIDHLADLLIGFGNLSNLSLNWKKIFECCPDNKLCLEYLDVFSFMYERIDQRKVQDLSENLAEIDKEIKKLSEEKNGYKKNTESKKERWSQLAEETRGDLRELQMLRYCVENGIQKRPFMLPPAFGSATYYRGNLPEDPKLYAAEQSKIQEGLNALVAFIDKQILDGNFDAGVMRMLRRLFSNISKLDDLQQKFASIQEKETALVKEINATTQEFKRKKQMLIKELNNIPKSGRMALFYLNEQYQIQQAKQQDSCRLEDNVEQTQSQMV